MNFQVLTIQFSKQFTSAIKCFQLFFLHSFISSLNSPCACFLLYIQYIFLHQILFYISFLFLCRQYTTIMSVYTSKNCTKQNIFSHEILIYCNQLVFSCWLCSCCVSDNFFMLNFILRKHKAKTSHKTL